MRNRRSFSAALVAGAAASLLGCGAAYAQASMNVSPLPALGMTSPLGIPNAPVGQTGIPLGATELATPGVSPTTSGAAPMIGATCAGASPTLNVRRPALRRWRYGRKRAGRLCRVCDGISAYGLHDGSRLNGAPCWNSAGLDRTGRWRPQSSVRRSESDSLRARDELADASRRHEPARDTVGIRGTEHAQPPVHPDRCPDNPGSPDDVRSACDSPGPGLSSDALTLTK